MNQVVQVQLMLDGLVGPFLAFGISVGAGLTLAAYIFADVLNKKA